MPPCKYVISGSNPIPPSPAHFGTPVPSQFEDERFVEISEEEARAAIDRHCANSSRQLEETLQQADPATREAFLSNPHIPGPIRESLRARVG